MKTTAIETFTVQFNNICRFVATTFATLEDARTWGLKTGQPFGVSSSSGAMVWVWEMRP